MAENYLIEPDPGFIKEVVGLGGESLKKCYQCATCSVACPISPDNKPFPRKEMIAASWGLKDRLVGNHDIWLCHNCGDCSTLCPRDAKPGDVLAAIRQYAITDYAAPKALGKMVNDPSKLPVLLGIPTVLFIVVGLLTGLLDFSPGGDEVVQWHFFSTWLVDMFFVPLALWVIVSFALALKRFLGDIHANALETGKTDKAKIEPVGFVLALIRVIPTILTHRKFTECGENNSRSTPHLMVLFSFIALVIVTTYAFITLYGLGIHSPHSQLNPIKWLANAGGIALIVGSLLLIKERRAKKDEVSTYKDWYLLWLVFGLGLSGMLTEMFRLADAAFLTYFTYFVHLVLVFNLVAFLPFSKLAHLVYRTTALAYDAYIEREK